MNEEELDKLLAEGEAKEKERLEQEAIRSARIQRERRLEKAFGELNVLPDTYHRETKDYPEYKSWPYCPPPPEGYWRWYAKRVIRVSEHIANEGWKDDLARLDIHETNGKIALGILFHAFEGDVDSLAKKIEKAIMRHEDGPDTKAWLVIRIARMLTHSPEKPTDAYQQSGMQAEVVSGENPEDAIAGPKWTTEEVIDRLLRRMKRGDKFPSRRKLQREIGCPYYRVEQAIKKNPELHAWARTKKQKRSTKGMTDSINESLEANGETDPAKIVERRDAAEVALRKLIENAKDKNKARYLKIQAECNGDAELTLLRIEQERDLRSYKIRDRG